MNNHNIWGIFVGILLFVMLFGNTKVRLTKIICEQIQVFENDKTKKFSFWDFFCFIIFPIVVAVVIVLKLKLIISVDLAELFTTVFSIIFTVLFGFAAILVAKIDSKKELEKKVAEETFVSIITSTTLSLIAGVLSIVLTQVNNTTMKEIISIIVLSASFMIVMLLLLITKRTFLLYVDNK